MIFQRLSLATILIVLSLMQINASSMRQVTSGTCPAGDFCPFVTCGNGICFEDKTTNACFRCLCYAGFTGRLCETAIATPNGCNPPCQNGGQCEQIANNALACVCPPNYTGSQCETSIFETHPCVIQPESTCQNGGTCTILDTDYLCSCPTGFSGRNCETQNSTACDANMCGAHGTCRTVVLPNGAGVIGICICEGQWTGPLCDVSLAGDCSTGFCQSGGTCLMNGNTPFCICPPTHTGEQCQIVLSSSTTTTTTTATMITATMTTVTATALSTTTGTSTARPTSSGCSSNPCLNGGRCFNTGSDFVCLCGSQYTGRTCAVFNAVTTPLSTTTSSADTCSPNPCNNGGACYKYSNSFVCVCTAAYTGQTCDMVKTTAAPSVTTPSSAITCANQPCLNGATCYTTGSSYFCYCGANSSYTGKNCDTPKAASDPSCPLNCSPGYCVRTGNGQQTYACMCSGTLTPTSCSSN